MNSKNFCFWLQGYFEITGSGPGETLEPEQVQTIERHLNLVFAVEPNTENPFCKWLREALVLVSKGTIGEHGVAIIRERLNLCFKHVIDPKMGDQAQQDLLNNIHHSGPTVTKPSRPPFNPATAVARC